MSFARPDRIVIADDDAPMRELLRTLLSFSPAVEIVGEASTGAEAVWLALERRADAVVLDVRMPGIDGARAAEVIRAYRPRVKVLFHTSEASEELQRRAERLDAPILLKGDPGVALLALDELLAGTDDRVDPVIALIVAALERNVADGVVVLDSELRVLFYDSGAADLLGDPPSLAPLDEALHEASASGDDALVRAEACTARAVPLLEAGRLAGVAAYLTAL